MPHPLQDTFLRRNSAVSDYEGEMSDFDAFLQQRIVYPDEWSTPAFAVERHPQTQSIPRPPSRPHYAADRLPLPSPSPEHAMYPADWWHGETNIRHVNGTGELWSGGCVPFFPDHGNCRIGISMKLARLGTGMRLAQTPLSDFLHKMKTRFTVSHPMLSIQWPGYESISHEEGLRPLHIQRPLRLHPNMPLADLAKQLADYFFEFVENYAAHCNPHNPHAIPLGSASGLRAVNFNRLRMVKLWTPDAGRHWNLEVAIVDDYMLNC
ncbi:hypothetical protein B0H11DRAFT_2196813 [Mycena galericulata]|nr:hypothetical protein B0H11DRAFT_2196813 [Mycena galericulata]